MNRNNLLHGRSLWYLVFVIERVIKKANLLDNEGEEKEDLII